MYIYICTYICIRRYIWHVNIGPRLPHTTRGVTGLALAAAVALTIAEPRAKNKNLHPPKDPPAPPHPSAATSRAPGNAGMLGSEVRAALGGCRAVVSSSAVRLLLAATALRYVHLYMYTPMYRSICISIDR